MKTKQIVDLSLRTFADETEANAWLAQYAEPDVNSNDLVFPGLRYNNKTDGEQYEAGFDGASWKWTLVENISVIPESQAGGADIFVINSIGIGAALADPSFDADLLAINPEAKVVLDITVDQREDTVDPNIQVTIETDGGKEYVTDYFVVDATNEDTSTGGLPILGSVTKTNMVFVGGTGAGEVTNDRRFRGDISFPSKPAGLEVTQIRISGNGGVSQLIPINRAAPVSSAVDIDNFVITSVGVNQTHVRGTQTYSLDFHFDLTTTVGGVVQSDVTFPTSIILSGDAIESTYEYIIPGGDRPTTEFGTVSDFVVTVSAIPSSTTVTNDLADFTFVSKNAQNVQSDPLLLSSLGVPSISGVPLDNILLTISGGVFAYPLISNTTRFGNITQKALRTTDIARVTPSVAFTIIVGGIDVGSNAVWRINAQTNFTSDIAGDISFSGASDVASSFNITGLPATGEATVSNAYVIQVDKPKNNSTVSNDVIIRYQQTDLALTATGIRIERDPGFTRTYTFNQETLGAVIETSANTAVVPDGSLSQVDATNWNVYVTINKFGTIRQLYAYQFYAVGEAGEELLDSEVSAPNDNSIVATGFTNFDVDYSSTSGNTPILVNAGTYNGVTVSTQSYEIDLQSSTTPGVGAGSVLTVEDPTKVIAINSAAGVVSTYSIVDSRYLYVDNTVGTYNTVINLEETV